ncbi:hypothetical protein FHL15_005532 [Xylaria flabelliformis]|uniref:Uncharacterized protein n=1 Tax=Xylaria flabelliformis TaxID=2512241 RepID=A0A553I028_9PEZI|nr:hypothetical protein FHL15_005532 [Xylaria flabelliformis]
MSQGYKANRLAQILNPPAEQPRTIPISHILNPMGRQSRTIPLAQILNPVQDQSRTIHLAQILNPVRNEQQPFAFSQILNPLTPCEEPDLIVPFESQSFHLINEKLDDTSSKTQVTQRERSQTDNVPASDDSEQPDAEFVGLEEVASDPEISIAKQIAERIIAGLQSNVEAPKAEFWRTLDADFSALRMADALWDRSRSEEDSKPVRWLNRFYASCMRQILRHRGLIPVNLCNQKEDPQKQSKDRYAAATDIINMAANKFVNNVSLSKLFFVRQDRHSVVDRLLATELGNMPEHTNKSVRNPAAVISVLWKEDAEPVPLDGPFDGPKELMRWDEPLFPTISQELKDKIMGVALGDTCKKKRYCPEDEEVVKTKPQPRVQMITRWCKALKALSAEIEGEMQSFKEPLRCRSTLMLIERGGIRRDTRACVNWIVPIRLKKPRSVKYEPKVEFDTGPGTASELKDWLSLPLVTIGGDIRIRMVDEPLAFIWIRWYQRQHWSWLDNEPLEESVDHDKMSA